MAQPDGERSRSDAPAKLRVFISYSRVDGVFMELVREALIARGYGVAIDKTDIVEGEDWRTRLDRLILAVEAVVFVISPDSVARWDAPPPHEAVCAWEIRRTIELGKRLVAVDFRRASDMTLPPQLKVPNHIDAVALGSDFSEVADAHRRSRAARDIGAGKALLDAATEAYARLGKAWSERWTNEPMFTAVVDGLDRALNVDTVLWERELAKWLQRAETWRTTKAEDQPGKLLPIGELADVNGWLSRRTASAPPVPPIIEELSKASATKIEEDDKRQRRIIGLSYVKPAIEALKAGSAAAALRFVAAAIVLARDHNLQLVPELIDPALQATASIDQHVSIQASKDPTKVVAIDPSGDILFSAGSDKQPRFWNAQNGSLLREFPAAKGECSYFRFSEDGRLAVAVTEDGMVRIWRLRDWNEFIIEAAPQRSEVGWTHIVSACALSLDGSLLAVATIANIDRPHELHIIECDDGHRIRTFKYEDHRITALAWISESTLVSGHFGTTIIWSLEEEGLPVEIPLPTERNTLIYVTDFHVMPDGLLLAACEDGGVYWVNPLTETATLVTPRIGSSIEHIDGFVDDAGNRHLIAASQDKLARVHQLDVASEPIAFKCEFPDSATVALANSTGMLAACGADHGVLHDLRDGAEVRALTTNAKCWSTYFDTTSKRLATGHNDGAVHVWDTKRDLQIMRFQLTHLTAPVFLSKPDEILVANNQRQSVISDLPVEWKPQEEICLGQLLSSDKSVLLTAVDQFTLSIATLNSTERHPIRLKSDLPIYRCSMDANGSVIAASTREQDASQSASHTIVIWHMARPDKPVTWKSEIDGYPSEAGKIAVSPCGRYIAVQVGERDIVIFLSDSAQSVGPLLPERGKVRSIEFHASELALLVTYNTGGVVYRPNQKYRAQAGEYPWMAASHHGRSYGDASIGILSSQGRKLAIGTIHGEIVFWSFGEKGGSQRFVSEHRAHKQTISEMVSSPDGSMLASGDTDGGLVLWAWQTASMVKILREAGSKVSWLSFNSDSSRLAALDEDGLLSLWDCAREATIARHGSDPGLLVAAALADGVGALSTQERKDFLLRELRGQNLFDLLVGQRSIEADNTDLQRCIKELREPRHDNCYLSPTQLAEKFRLEKAHPTASELGAGHRAAEAGYAADEHNTGAGRIVAAGDVADNSGASELTPASEVILRQPVTAEDLAGQEFVEAHRGVAIFHLADGRYHVVNNFAVATLKEARAAAEEMSGTAG